jgi:pSer/pThr/pTyr-binding forkhead associated (FHA) protein
MEENFETAHSLQGPHRLGDLPANFVHLRLSMHPAGPSLELSLPQAIVGRHSGADLRLPAPEVSRRHCRLFFEDGFWRVHDLQSLNGIYVNEERVCETALYDGDLLRIGDFTFRVAYLDRTPQAEIIKSIAEALPRQAS